MKTFVYLFVLALIIFCAYLYQKDKKRVEKVVQKKIDHIKKAENNSPIVDTVVYVSKDKNDDTTTSFAQALKDAQIRQKEQERKDIERQLEYKRKQDEQRRQRQRERERQSSYYDNGCETVVAQSFDSNCYDDNSKRHHDNSSSSSSSHSSYGSSSSYDSSSSSSYDSSSSSDSGSSYSSSDY